MYNDYFEAGFRIFGLHGATDGECDCGNPKCDNLYKHPKISNWQHTPSWSEEQLDNMEQYGQFKTGFGVLCSGYLIIDIDPRNGGDESYERLIKDLDFDFKKDAGFVVFTGGGGWHIYYKYDGAGLLSHLEDYKGIDFKSSGFVVGCGSIHASGCAYEMESGSPDEVKEAPSVLMDKLSRVVTDFNPVHDKLSDTKVAELLAFIDPDEYHEWVECGMICENELGEEGLAVWDQWSQRSDKYNHENITFKWHSFGKSQTVVTIGTLIQKATDNGYQESVTFESTLVNDIVQVDRTIDLLKPPGLVGECVDYINSCSRYPRESLAVSAALTTISSVGGLRFEDETYGVTPNLFTFNVAGSATGKEAIQQAHSDLLVSAGLGASIYGTIKSEQETYRNISRHQCTNYLIDEFGILLNKIEQSAKTGAASYMGGVIGALMSIYSKANGKLLLGADHADDLRKQFSKQIASLKQLKEDHTAKDHHIAELEALERVFDCLLNGYIDNPFLSLSGYTTPATFNNLVTYAQATNGFIGRAIIFEEKNNNPVSKKGFKRAKEIPMLTILKLKSLFGGGESQSGARIEFNGVRQNITTTDSAIALLETIERDLHGQAETAMETNGLEAIIRRSFELVLKISMILAMGDGEERTEHHVKWAYALIKMDIENKINLTGANMAEDEKNLSDEILSKVIHRLDKICGQSVGSIKNKMRKISKENIQSALDYLVKEGKAKKTTRRPKRGPVSIAYFSA